MEKLNKKYGEIDNTIQYVFQSHYVMWAYYQELMGAITQINLAGGYTIGQWSEAMDAMDVVGMQLLTTQGKVNYIYLEETRIFFSMSFFGYSLCYNGPTFDDYEAGATLCGELYGDLTSLSEDLDMLKDTIAVTDAAIKNAVTKVFLK